VSCHPFPGPGWSTCARWKSFANSGHNQVQNNDTAQTQIELPWSEQYFAQLGLVLGVNYHRTQPESSDTGTDYIPTAEPGHRMPHLWLTSDRSTLDAIGEWFTLLTPDPDHWKTTTAWPLHIEPLPSEHADRYDLGPQGALLIRPDGHIGARWPDHLPGDSTLDQVLTTITGVKVLDGQ
jgi:putative polyketide hydroxylase